MCISLIYVGSGNFVPCGKCPECLNRRRKEWSVRIQMEAKMHEHVSFITLTYDEEFLPRGETSLGILWKPDLQKFFKRLRRRLEYAKLPCKFRYFACGEYGDKFGRPHFHVILFGPDLSYATEHIRSAWKFGFINVKPAKPADYAYVAKYSVKQWSRSVEDFREFIIMSRNPGIGSSYVDKYSDSLGEKCYFPSGPYKLSLPSYVKNRIFKILPNCKLSLRRFLSYGIPISCENDLAIFFSDFSNYIDKSYATSLNILSKLRLKGRSDISPTCYCYFRDFVSRHLDFSLFEKIYCFFPFSFIRECFNCIRSGECFFVNGVFKKSFDFKICV